MANKGGFATSDRFMMEMSSMDRKKFTGHALVLGWAMLLLGVGCADHLIQGEELYDKDPGFRIGEEAQIEDNTQNRKVLDVLAQYRKAVVAKDFGTLKRLVSEDYYDNGGTTDTTEDDYGWEKLSEVFELMANHAEEIKYKVVVKDLKYENERAMVTYEYEYAYKYDLGPKPSWDAGVEVNQVEMIKHKDRWRITSGL